MNKDIRTQAKKLNIKHRKKRLWYRILTVPICIVVFVTTYAMILPAITLESTPDTYCGYEEHVHTDECYEIPGVDAHTEIKCSVQNSLHTHTDSCYNGDGSLKCGEADYIIHQHDSCCFNAKGELICSIPENSGHTHTSECYENGSLVCGMTKGVEHQHTSDCLVEVEATEPQGLICTKPEHKHTEDCFMQQAEAKRAGAGTEIEEEPDAKVDNDNTSDAVHNESSSIISGVKIYNDAYSDKSTSKIESEFGQSKNDDGKILTDKSVIFGKDDYSAFTDYSDSLFSITLSALGQQYENQQSTLLHTPLDVVFILDTSGSMVINSDDNSYRTRGEDAVKTLNELAGYIMDINPDNRFGIATFSTDYDATYNNGFDCHELLPIGSYDKSKTSDILNFTKGSSSATYYNSTVSVNTSVSGTSSTNSTYFYGGTYTTAGYYQAAQMLTGTDQASRTVNIDGHEIQRIPIIILITDGEVTFRSNGTNRYEYSTNYSNDNSGSAMSANEFYYTILSAYHYKSLVSDAYFDNAKMYTVGIGADAVSDYDFQAILDPSETNLNNVSSTYTTPKNNLINGTNFPTNYTSAHGTEYYFCDGTYTSENFDPNLTSKLKNFISENAGEFVYTSSQRSQTDVQFVDIIGSGMEIKSDFVLRYDGTNYPMSLISSSGGKSVYRYTGDTTVKPNHYATEAVALSGITVTVDTTADGNQRVTWDIPASLLPENTHAKTSGFYYKMLPVRLMYQVGMNAESQAAVQSMTETSEPLTFYTNAYGTGIKNAVATIEPSTAETTDDYNPYYENFAGETLYKDANTSVTSTSYRDVSKQNAGGVVTFTLGNNGKIVFSSKKADLTSVTTIVSAAKVWQDSNGNVITDSTQLPSSVTAVLKADGQVYATHALNSDNNWSYEFTDLPTEWVDGTTITWTVEEETVPGGYEMIDISQSGSGGFVSASSLSDGRIYTFAYNNSYLINETGTTDVSLDSTESMNGRWKAIQQTDGTYMLQNLATGNYLGMYRSSSGGWSSRYTYVVVAAAEGASSTYYNWSLSSNRLYSSASAYLRITSSTYSGTSIGGTTSSNSATTLTTRMYDPVVFTVINREKSTLSLEITKVVQATDTTGTFNFEVTIDGGTPITFSLRNDETYTLSDIPAGSLVTVKELNSDGFVVSYTRLGENEQSGLDTYTFTINNDSYLTVHNTAGVILPETGGVGVYWFIIGGITIMAAAVMIGYLLRRRCRKESE